MFNLRFLVPVLMFGLLAAPASNVWAGGDGGTKRESTIRVRNTGNDPIGVLVDPSQAVLQDVSEKIADGTLVPADITDAGGKIVNAGETVTFRVRAGQHQIYAGTTEDEPGSTTVNVSRGQSVTINFPGDLDN